jgi:hypothetical protein
MVSKRKFRPEDVVLIGLVVIAVVAIAQMISIRDRYRHPERLARLHELVLLKAHLDRVAHTLGGSVYRHLGCGTPKNSANMVVDFYGPNHTLVGEQKLNFTLLPGDSWDFSTPAPVNTSTFAIQKLELQ